RQAWITKTGNTTVLSLEHSSYPYTVIHLIHDPTSSTTPIRTVFGIDKLYLPYGIDYVLRVSFANQPEVTPANRPVFHTDANGQDSMAREYRRDLAVELSYEPFASFISVPVKTQSGYRA